MCVVYSVCVCVGGWRVLNSPKMVYNSMLKPSEEEGVAGSEASESLLEDIKKLNAQQRPDVPLCFIYAPISHIPMAVNTLFFSSSILSLCLITARSSLTSHVLQTRPLPWVPTIGVSGVFKLEPT